MSYNIQAVPVTPEQPKNVPNQQLFVWLNKHSIAASVVYFGANITGTNTTAHVVSGSGITYANAGDVYVNNSTTEDKGRVYTCVLAGVPAVAKWAYVGTFDSITCDIDSVTTAVVANVEPYKQQTFNAASISSVTLNIPNTLFQGYIAEIDFVSGTTAPVLSIVNNSGVSIVYILRGYTSNTYTPSANKEVNMLFRYNGESLLCVVVEIDK